MDKKDFIKERFLEKYGTADFETSYNKYLTLKPFKAQDNFFEKSKVTLNDKDLFVIRLATQYHIKEALEAALFDLNDPNLQENLKEGNIGTAGRIAKVLIGGFIDDENEMGSGRFMKKPRIATFPNTQKTNIPITKRVSVVANCSHHFLAFSTQFDNEAYAIISYIPDKFVLGISKLQRLTDWICRRYWLQEDLTKALYDEISKTAETPDVYVGLFNIKHTCEWLRGSKNPESGFSSEFYGGAFEDKTLRDSLKAK